jgi:hypothetical protein
VTQIIDINAAGCWNTIHRFKIVVFLVVTCIPVGTYRYLGGTCCLYLQVLNVGWEIGWDIRAGFKEGGHPNQR